MKSHHRTVKILAWACGLWLIFDLCSGGVAWTPAFFTALFLFLSELSSSANRTELLIFWGTLAAYLSTFHWRGGDDIPTSLVPIAFLRHGTFALDSLVNPWLSAPGMLIDFTVPFHGHIISRYPIAASLLALPVYALPIATGAPLSELFIHNLSKISASLITTTSVWVFYRAAILRAPRKVALLLSLVYAFGTFSFSTSSQALWQHGAAQLGLAIAFWGLFGDGILSDALCGFGLGLAVASRPDTVFVALAIALFLLFRKPRRIPATTLGAAAPMALLFWYWVYYTGRALPPEFGIQQGLFVHFQLDAFLAYLASPTHGLLWFSPAVLFGIWAGLKKERHPAGPWILSGCLATWIFFSFYANWLGGMTFGPRYLSAICVPLLILCADAWRAFERSPLWRTGFCSAAAASIIVHSIGAYFRWPNSFNLDSERFYAWNWTRHPFFRLCSADGPLEKIPLMARLITCGALIAIAIAIEKYFASCLATPENDDASPLTQGA